MTPEVGHAKSDSAKGDKNGNHAPYGDLHRILIAGGFLFAGLLFGSIFIPNLTERVKFFTVNALSLLVFVAIVVQAHIYRRQWEVMKTQEGILERQAKAFEAQVVAMQESMKIAQQTMIYAQRAYLAISERRIDSPDQKYLFFRLTIKNFGLTPASHVRIFATAEMRKQPPDPHDTSSADWHDLGLIPPGEAVEAISNSIGKTQEDWASQRRRSRNADRVDFYCWGIVQYRDIFEEDRETSFCLIEDLQGPLRVRPYMIGNETT